MINWHDTTGTLEGDCPWHDDRVFAELVAKKLDIPLHVVDLSADYRTRVVDYMFSEYEKGRTPNPDVLCNREIKFDVFLREALRLGADFVATGHYCRKAEETLPDGRTIYKLLAGTDPNKDQSYFLCQLSQEQLRYALFPVGALLKPEVRRIAAEQGLATAKRKDSQGICFVGKIDLPAFLQQKLASKRGNVHEILPTWPKYGPKARIPAGTPDAGQAIPAPASPAAGHSAPMSSANTPAANTPAGIGQTVTSPASKPISAAGRPDGDPHSPGGQHAADVPPTTEQLAALAAPWRYTVRDGKKIGEHGGRTSTPSASARDSASAGARNRCSSSPPTPYRTSSMSAKATATPACGDRHCISPPARYTGSTPRARCRQAIAPASASASATASPCRRPRSSSATREATSSSTPPSGASHRGSSPHGTTATSWSVRG